MENNLEIQTFVSALEPTQEAAGEPQAECQRAAVAIILRQSNANGLETLFIKRAKHPKDPWSGHMAFPGGREEDGDESLEATARRETLEEVGIRLRPEMRIGRLKELAITRMLPFKLGVTPFVYHCEDSLELTHGDEVSDTVWIPLSYFRDPANVRQHTIAPDSDFGPFPSFQYGPYTIWGITYWMLADLLMRVGVELPMEPGAR